MKKHTTNSGPAFRNNTAVLPCHPATRASSVPTVRTLSLRLACPYARWTQLPRLLSKPRLQDHPYNPSTSHLTAPPFLHRMNPLPFYIPPIPLPPHLTPLTPALPNPQGQGNERTAPARLPSIHPSIARSLGPARTVSPWVAITKHYLPTRHLAYLVWGSAHSTCMDGGLGTRAV